jgi:succinyl-CoA synthetase beta subunit
MYHDLTEAFSGGKCIIKSQISRGGRAKGRFDSGLQGGIQLVDSPQAAQDMAAKMLGNRLITKQTSDVGIPVQEVYVAERLEYKDELYLAMTVDRDSYRPAIILSKSGGVDIECVAKEDAGALRTFHFDMSTGITADVASDICSFLELSAKESENMRALLESMYRVFSEGDAIMLEVNPLVRRADGSLTCIGAKFTFDDAAAKRQKDLFALRLSEQEVPDEIEAAKWGLVYVRMDGNIGNVVNGAGLAMATNDAISLYGGSSANFLDAGGQATKETMVKAFSIVLNDKRVTTILVNIYGGKSRER